MTTWLLADGRFGWTLVIALLLGAAIGVVLTYVIPSARKAIVLVAVLTAAAVGLVARVLVMR